MDAHDVGNLAAPVLAFATWCTLGVGLAQRGDQFPAQFTNRLDIDTDL